MDRGWEAESSNGGCGEVCPRRQTEEEGMHLSHSLFLVLYWPRRTPVGSSGWTNKKIIQIKKKLHLFKKLIKKNNLILYYIM